MSATDNSHPGLFLFLLLGVIESQNPWSWKSLPGSSNPTCSQSPPEHWVTHPAVSWTPPRMGTPNLPEQPNPMFNNPNQEEIPAVYHVSVNFPAEVQRVDGCHLFPLCFVLTQRVTCSERKSHLIFLDPPNARIAGSQDEKCSFV